MEDKVQKIYYELTACKENIPLILKKIEETIISNSIIIRRQTKEIDNLMEFIEYFRLLIQGKCIDKICIKNIVNDLCHYIMANESNLSTLKRSLNKMEESLEETINEDTICPTCEQKIENI